MLIYVAHPFNNEDSNREKVARIIDSLIYEYPEHNWLSPIHATGHWYQSMSYERGMDWCLALLDKCDEMWVYGDFQNSKGCMIEIQHCVDNGKPYWIKPIPLGAKTEIEKFCDGVDTLYAQKGIYLRTHKGFEYDETNKKWIGEQILTKVEEHEVE